MSASRDGAADPLLIAEVVLVLLLFGLGVALFIIPAARADESPDWWVSVLLAILFFAAVFTDTLRRRRGARASGFEPAADAPEPEPGRDSPRS